MKNILGGRKMREDETAVLYPGVRHCTPSGALLSLTFPFFSRDPRVAPLNPAPLTLRPHRGPR